MVKIERIENEATKQAIESLAREKIKANGKSNTDAVVKALQEVFHGKCYLCEDKHSTVWEVEHLIPHGGDVNLKFDWHNLFWACGHCNHIKGSKYKPILDCTKVPVDEVISFRQNGDFGTEETLQFEKIDSVEDCRAIQVTCALLHRIYYGETAQEKVGAKILRHGVRDELTKFKSYISDYHEALGEDKKDLFATIRSKLKSNSEFAAFKRWIVRDKAICRDFIDCWKNNNEVSP